MMEFLLLVASLLIAFSIGSNDTSNSFGICIGCNALEFKKATTLLFVFVLLGALLQGEKVMETVGKELVEVDIYVLSISLLVSAIFIMLSNYKGLPVSSHQVIVGSLVGSGFALSYTVNFETIFKILLSWIISPFGALFLSILTYISIEKIIFRYSTLKAEKLLKALLLIGGVLIAYNTGANELATALGPVVYYGLLNCTQSSVIGSILIWLGVILLSYKVIETIGKGITTLDPRSGFSAQFGAGLCVWFFTSIGMPVSTTYCIIGGVSGVGILKGIKTVRKETLRKIVLNWFLTPISSFLICLLVASTLTHLNLL
ncbi:MAG: inorganic phosphate transporter [Candidatus Heimdallarchaeaceae archaeon]